MLPVDDTIAEDLHSSLVVREAWVLSSNCSNHSQQVLAFADFNCEHAASLCKFQSQLDQLIALFPIHRIFAKYFVKVVQDFSDPFSLVLVIYLYKLQKWSLVTFDYHEIVDCKNFKDLLDVHMRELAVVRRNVSKDACHSVADERELLSRGAPPDSIVQMIDQQV